MSVSAVSAVAVSAVLLLVVSGCSAEPEPAAGTTIGLADWSAATLGDQLEAARQSGFAASGKTDPNGGPDSGSTSFSGVQPGWYAVTIACRGSSDLSISLENPNGLISEGSIDCDMPPVTSTVQISSSNLQISTRSTADELLWAVAAEPTEEPAR